MDLYDTVVWFDDWMHFMNTGLLAGAFVLLTLPRGTGLARTMERALAFGATSAIAWELAEYGTFVSRTSERAFAYGDTLGDLAFGTAGAVVSAVAVGRLWQQDGLLRRRALKQRARAELRTFFSGWCRLVRWRLRTTPDIGRVHP